MFIQLPALVLVVAVGIITYFKWAFAYWEKKHLPIFEKPSIPFGNIKIILTTKLCVAVYTKMIYDKIKSQGLKHAGGFIFFKPFYTVNDPDLIKEILQRRFDHFYGRGLFTSEKDPLSVNLAFADGEKWRTLHKKITPAFTTGKIKGMFEIFVNCGSKLQQAVDSVYENTQTIDISDVSGCYTLDIIGASAYDLELNSFNEPNSKFRLHAKKALDLGSITRTAKIIFGASFPNLARRLGVRIFTEESTNFFIDLVKNSVKFRKANNIDRKDLLQLLIENKKDLSVEEIDKNTTENTNAINEIAAQVLASLIGGFETPSLTLAYSLYELSVHPYIQNKLRDEIDQVLRKYNGKITYDAVMDMKYLTLVVEETLRKYPPLGFLTRKCMADCEISDTNVVVKKGVYVGISVLGLHYDPDYYPEPERFDPERFSDENKQKRPPYTYLPFGEGPRMCPAYRFGVLEVKVGLTVLLQRYVFSLNKRTPVPIELGTNSITLVPKEPIFLDIKKRNGIN